MIETIKKKDYILGLEDDYGTKTPVKTIKICNIKMKAYAKCIVLVE